MKNPARERLLYSSLAMLLLIGSVAVRAITEFTEIEYRAPVAWLVALYTALFASEWFISRRLPVYRVLYFIVQCVIVLILQLVIPPFDYFTALYMPLIVQAFWSLPQASALSLTGVFAFLAGSSLVESFSWAEGTGYTLTYAAVFGFTAIVCIMTLRAERAQERSQALLAELGDAHLKLQAYAEQVESLATVQERARMARELHDSVTQTIFSLTLTAQAARILLERDPGRVAAQLEHLQSLAQSALAEMRTLIQQRPRSIAEEGLAAALRRHAAERQAADGLAVDLHISGTRRLPQHAEEALFRVIQEALNNVVKHAQTGCAAVTLDLDADPLVVRVDDQGAGFDPQRAARAGSQPGEPAHFGLSSMADRVRALGGRLVVESQPGMGTHIHVEDLRVEEQAHE